MLRVLNKTEFQNLDIQTSLINISDEFLEFIWSGFYREGLWLEYWENPVINFKFNIVGGIVTIYKGDFSSLFTTKELELFFNNNVHVRDLLDWARDNVNLEVVKTLPMNSKKITKIWKYDYKYYLSLSSALKEDNPIFKNYYEFNIQNTKIIKSLPYMWCSLSLYCENSKDLDDKIYWINLCMLTYVARKYN